MTAFALLAATPEHFARLLAGTPPEPDMVLPASAVAPPEVLAMLAGLAAGIEAAFAPAAWLVLDGPRVTGLLSLTLPPADGVLTIGYGIAPGEEGRGAATGAVAALIDWVARDGRAHEIAAETNVGNIASQRVLEHNGFCEVGRRHDDEDGDLICWRWTQPGDV